MCAIDSEFRCDCEDGDSFLIPQSDDFGVVVVREFDVPPSPDVHDPSNWLYVRGIDAMAHFTEVIELHSFGDGADFSFVHNSMRFEHLPINSNTSVPLGFIDRSLPNPARSIKPAIFNDIAVNSSVGLGVVRDKEVGLTFDVPQSGARSICDTGFLPASTLTKTLGNRAIVGEHSDLLSRVPRPRTLARRGGFAYPNYIKPGATCTN